MRPRKAVRAHLAQLPCSFAVPTLLLIMSMAAGPLACPGRRFVEEPPRTTPEELLRWSELSKSGREHLRFGRLEQAEEELGAAFELSSGFRASDARRLSAISNLRRLAVAYWNTGRPQDFARLIERLMRTCREVPGSQTGAMADALVLLGSLRRQEGELTVSREAFELALSIRTQIAGEGDPSVAQVRGELGLTWIELGDLDRAEQEIAAASDVVEQASGRENPMFANMLIARSQLREAQKRTEDAEAELQRAVEIDRAAVGPSDRATLKVLAELARFYQRNDRAADAEATLKEIVAAERDRDEESTRYARSLHDLALFYIQTGRPAEAEAATRTALEIFVSKNITGPPKATLLDTLATSLQRQGRYPESEQLYREAIEESQQASGASADNLEEIAGHYGELLRLLGRDAEAENLLEKLRDSPSDGSESETGPGAQSEATGEDPGEGGD